ncbi:MULTISPECIES: hypothetical protein [unclassified Neisseria]|uniref:hypothetical protein n=1 Tax=unclassified Neisseria TaxID=2623750 RepID=UPI001071839B|nr:MULTISPECIES: hypothetical protein [unclassified Neisseria]MBF0804934.1 hypothetical protein [Neisseria sp. 19428wB4_WF04]TFU39350.1 hypothetical protein E4T99_11565 [Neisseria sp. WF04]
MRVERDYSNIKAKVWRERAGYLCCELNSIHGHFILLMVSADKADTEADVVQTALRCLSSSDLAVANQEAA